MIRVTTFLKYIFWRVLNDIKTKKKKGVFALVLASIFWGLYGLSAGLLWLLFLIFFVYEWENYIIGSLALIALVSCPLFIFFNQSQLADMMVVYVYFFLVMMVTLQLIEYGRYPDKYAKN